MKYGICTLIFGNTSYLVGACLSFYVHRQFIKKNNLDIDLIAMVDDKIYKYKDILELYFDKIIKIDLDEIVLNYRHNAKEYKNYSTWVKYSINKWKIFNIENYDKILFIDVDVLPLDISFYDIFETNTPAIFVGKSGKNKLNKKYFSNKSSFNNLDYTTDKHLKNNLNATIILIKPNPGMWKEYMKFIKICEGKNGYDTRFNVDETTLTYFLIFYKNIQVFKINEKYVGSFYDYNEKKLSFDFMTAVIKSWNKMPFLTWNDENIWHIIAHKVMPNSVELNKIYIKHILEHLFLFYKKYTNNEKLIMYYNTDAMKNKKSLKYINKIFTIIKNNTLDTLSTDDIKNIFTLSKIIHKNMKKEHTVNYNKLIEVL